MMRFGYGARARAAMAVVGAVIAAVELAPAASASTPLPGGGPVWSDAVDYPPADTANLFGLTCPSVGNCVAAGGLATGASSAEPVVAVESGGTWGPMIPLPLPADATSAGGGLSSVACTSATACVAVGFYSAPGPVGVGMVIPFTLSGGTATSSGAIAVTTSGAGAHPLPNSRLLSVSCPASGGCVAVGTFQDDATHDSLPMTVVPTGGGTAWTASGVTPPPAAVNSELTTISCPPTGACQAIGDYRDAATGQHVWTDRVAAGVAAAGIDVPLPSDYDPGPDNRPTGLANGVPYVSCPSADVCTAALSYQTTTDALPHPLVLPIMTGAPGPAIRPTGLTGVVSGISCVDASRCMLIASGLTAGGAPFGIAARESAGAWSSVSLPFSGITGIAALACASADDCVAPGQTSDPINGGIHAFFLTSATQLTANADSLPAASLGVPYRASLSATGGAGPVRWSVSSGSLPAGLSLDPATGAISGTPTAAGTSTFSATVTQAGPPAQTQALPLSIKVSGPTVPPARGRIRLVLLKTSGTKVRLALRCTGGPCAGRLKITGTEHLTRTTPTAVVAAAKKPPKKTRTKSLVLATGRYTLGHDTSKAVTLSLSRTVAKLLAKLHQISGKLTITPTGAAKPAVTKKVTFKSPRHKTKKNRHKTKKRSALL